MNSPRGFKLLLPTGGIVKPTVTVELYEKWYELFLVRSTREDPEPISFDRLVPFVVEGESAYVDHVPNPNVVRVFALANNYELDEIAEELIVGRWAVYHGS